jgi:predicted O-methyltransferase YrrM
MATSILDSIYETRQVEDERGGRHPLHSEITPDEGAMIASLIRDNGIDRTLEIGCAFGVSSLFICGALSDRPDPRHTIVDPFQSTEWRGIGVANLRRAGYEFVELIEETSEVALPRLFDERRTFQFALIDGFHTFDHILVDFFLADRLLEVGGIVVFDDLQLPGVRKLMRYIAGYPHYAIERTARRSVYPPSLKRRLFEWPLRTLAGWLPADYRMRIFDDSLARPDSALGLVSEMVALRKTGPDRRGSHWFVNF